MTEFIAKNWTYLVAGATVIAYIFDKSYNFWSDKKRKQQSYNRTFVAIVKFFYSYQKHKSLYEEKPQLNLPDSVFYLISKHIDTFNYDLEHFKEAILKESEIIPEISIESHVLFEFADRIRIMDKMSLTEPEMGEMSEQQKIMAKRALFSAMENVLNDFFKKIISKVQKKANVKKEFQDRLSYFGTEEHKIENFKAQKEVMTRYLESLYRQGAFPKEEFELISQTLLNKNQEATTNNSLAQ